MGKGIGTERFEVSKISDREGSLNNQNVMVVC